MMIDTRLLDYIDAGATEPARLYFLLEHYIVIIPGVAHAFCWHENRVCEMNLHIYSDSHDASTRRDQLRSTTASVSSF